MATYYVLGTVCTKCFLSSFCITLVTDVCLLTEIVYLRQFLKESLMSLTNTDVNILNKILL